MVPPPRYGLSLCSGGGGLDLGLGLAEPGFASACYVEIEEYPRQCLVAGQRAGYLHPAPIWDDLKTFNARPWRGICDTLLAGYPCQPFSQAGQRKGADDPRHLWPDIVRIIKELEPRWCFFENVAGHLSLGLDTVLRDLRSMGFTPAAGLFSAEETGAAHERQRVFIVAHRDDARSQRQQRSGVDAEGREVSARHAGLRGRAGISPPAPSDLDAWSAVIADAPDLAPAVSLGDIKRAADHLAQMVAAGELAEAEAESVVRGMAASLSQRTRSLRLLGNAVHPITAAYAWRSLSSAHGLGSIRFGDDE